MLCGFSEGASFVFYPAACVGVFGRFCRMMRVVAWGDGMKVGGWVGGWLLEGSCGLWSVVWILLVGGW